MSKKLLWTGLTLMSVTSAMSWSSGFVLAGAVIMVVGAVMMWMNK